MSLRARLTILSVVAVALMVGAVSAIDLAREIKVQFDSTLERADLYQAIAVRQVKEAVNSDPQSPIPQVLQHNADLADALLTFMTESKTLAEIAVSDPQGKILADSYPNRVGMQFENYPDFGLLARSGIIQKLLVLYGASQNYQLAKGLGVVGETPSLYVRVVVNPRLIRRDIVPVILAHAEISVAALAGVVLAALLFSAVAFRPIGRLSRTLDSMVRGEFENQEAPAPAAASDELGAVASKVNLLGQQLRGAQSDFSDLRGNFERLLAGLEDAVLVFGRDRRLVVASGSVERFLGGSRAGLIGKRLAEIFPDSTPIGLVLQQADQTGQSFRNRRLVVENHTGGNSGAARALVSADVLEAAQPGGPAAGLMVRLRDPEATRQIGRQLQTAERLSAISRITGSVAHEVKNPLNAILMHVELARLKLAKGDNDLVQQMDIIGSEIVRLDRVVKTFLDFTKPVELHPSDVPLESFVSEVAELARPLAEQARIEVVIEQHADGVSMGVDRDLLKQAMLNVVLNAIEAMPDGGQLRLESATQGETAEIRISDTGSGIPPAVKEKIFGLYFTTKEKGSGIGLAMTYRIVQLHDGTIECTSEPGKGATFIIRIPSALSSS